MIRSHVYFKILIGTSMYLALLPVCMAEKLEEVVKQATKTNPAILVQTARRYAQDNQLSEAVAGYLPRIDFAAAYGRDHNANYFTRLENPTNGDLTLTKSEAGFSIRQMIFDGFAVKGEVEANSARVKSSSYQVLAKLDEVIIQVTAAYIDTIMLRSIFMHAKENLISHQALVDQINSDEISNVQKGDLGLAKSRLSLAQTILLDLQKDIRDSQANYIRVVGAKPGVMFRPDAPEKKLPNSEDAAVAVALNNNPQIFMANAEINAARADKRASKANYFPKFDLEIAGTNNNNVDGYNQHTNSLSAMLQMTYNVFRGGKDVAAERKSAWAIEEKKQLLNENMRDIEQSMRHVWSAFTNYKGQLMYLKDRVDSMQQTRDAYYKEFTDGNRRILDLLDAEDELYIAKSNYVTAQYKELLSRFMILHGMGKIREYFNIQPPKSVAYSPKKWLDGY